MRAVEVAVPGELLVVERPDPSAAPGSVVVAVEAATVNPTDVAARRGRVRGNARMPYVLGWDFAGRVLQVGSGVREWAPGDPVVGMVPWYDVAGSVGTYTTHVVVDPSWLVARPPGLDAVTAATVPLNGLTAVQALEALAAPAGADILVTGASGAVGGFAVQLASRARHRVVALCSDGDAAWVRGLGAAEVFERTPGLPASANFACVLDAVPVGAPLLRHVADGGTVVTTRRPQSPASRGIRQRDMLVRLDAATLRHLVDMAAQGLLRTRVARTLPIDQAATAHALVERGGLRGKVVLVP